MIKSMTGYGRGIREDGTRKVTVEIKSVNHRYLDLNMKLPRKCNPLETQLRKYLAPCIGRGKVDVYISLEESAEVSCRVVRNDSLAAMYLDQMRRISEKFHLEDDVTVSRLCAYPDILTVEDPQEDAGNLLPLVTDAIDAALEQFLANREMEGERLCQDLLEKLTAMEQDVAILKERTPQILEEYRARLTQKVRELLGDTSLDENRIASEVIIYADKICIDEEIVRLESHVAQMRHALENGGEVGRKLDFIAQEMNREANTVLSKSTDVTIANVGISLKTLIEKVREQVQNIE